MKHLLLIFAALLATGQTSFADVSDEMNGLGGNRELIRRARGLDPKNKVRVVQNRTVDRDLRLELGVNYGGVAGGDPYVSTNNLGVNLDFHVNPRWSIGARYYNSSNTLSSEGKRVFESAQAARAAGTYYERPDIDYASDTYLGVINWYPMYGKLSLFDFGIAQFDVYLLAGAGQVKLRSGMAPTYTAGAGLGFWMTQHFSTRLEVRYQTYEDEIYTGPRQLDLTVISATLGFLL
ncbi:MAG: outer membrane beta-barrel domain-containing protein [Bdellovibrionales bacterium]